MAIVVSLLGKKRKEYLLRVTDETESVVIVTDENGWPISCSECQDINLCHHAMWTDQFQEVIDNSFNWQVMLDDTLKKGTTTSWRKLWATISDGLLMPGHPLFVERRQNEEARQRWRSTTRQVVNQKLYSMNVGELGCLLILGLPDSVSDLIDKGIRDWMYKGAMHILFEKEPKGDVLCQRPFTSS